MKTPNARARLRMYVHAAASKWGDPIGAYFGTPRTTQEDINYVQEDPSGER